MKIKIPIFHCFNNNFVIPAAVAFYSLLENANKNYNYEIIVAHNDISNENQLKLCEVIKKFKNASLRFINMKNFFMDWEKVNSKCHYSKEMFYKLKVASILSGYSKIIVSDVDVIYERDISEDFIKFLDDDENYLAGVFGVEKISYFKKIYEKEFTLEEINKLKIGAGYFFMNLEKIREDNLEEKFLKELENNIDRIKQPEQDILNMVCYPKIKKIPLRNMVCTYVYKLYDKENLQDEKNWTAKELKEAMENPVQIHYAGPEKPWNKYDSLKSDNWFYYLSQTLFLKEVLNNIENEIRPKIDGGGVAKRIFRLLIPITFKRKLVLTLDKIKKEKK